MKTLTTDEGEIGGSSGVCLEELDADDWTMQKEQLILGKMSQIRLSVSY